MRRRAYDGFDPWRLVGPGVIALLSAGAAAWGGYELGLRDAGEQTQRFVGALEVMFDAERRGLDEEKLAMGEHLNAIARRLGELQGEVLRLEALGERLVELGKLDAGEFNFAVVPPIGGPASEADLPARLPDMMADLATLAKRIEDREVKLGLLEDLLLQRKVEADARPAGVPISQGWISSRYGWRTDPITGKKNLHKGLDFAGKHGSDIIAVADGIVTFAGARTGFGKTVEIRHGYGFLTRYAHNHKLLVAEGDLVRQGQVIAKMGRSGRATGTHLHFEVIRNDRTVDPLKYVKKRREEVRDG